MNFFITLQPKLSFAKEFTFFLPHEYILYQLLLCEGIYIVFVKTVTCEHIY